LERDWNKNSILIVDDDYTSVVLFEEFLSTTQILVFSASNGPEAFNILHNHPIDLILMDIQLEDISGFILLSQIRDQYPNIPIVAETAFASLDYKKKCISSGFNGFLTKPINFDLLINEMDKFLGKAYLQA
jgi:two-component system, cell cycle response regulator DivK